MGGSASKQPRTGATGSSGSATTDISLGAASGSTLPEVPPTQTHATGLSLPADSSSVASSSSKYVHVKPSDVVMAGSGVVLAAAALSAVATYRGGSKSLIEDGINPSTRMRMIPVAFQTLMLSMLFTGVLGVGGFYGLRAAGLFSHDVAELPSAAEAARMIRGPRTYIREALGRERQQQQEGSAGKTDG